MMRLSVGFLQGAITTAIVLLSVRADAGEPDFARDIRPILERSCHGCHGPGKQSSGYRLDVRKTALKGGDSGEPAIIPHDAAASPLVHYISGEDPDLRMPPRESSLPALTPDEVAAVKAWIDAGPSWPDEFAGDTMADEPPHWSLQPLVSPPVPDGSPHPIDAFIRQRLTTAGLTPSPVADRRTLIRRLSYGLTGLPPTPEETAAFETDDFAGAYEALVDRLLQSPAHGERWARHWLDVVHFADSHGYEHDVPRENAWRYRDYVIDSFNRDTPYDRFIREQLAADVFYPEDNSLTPALGFLGAGPFDLSTYKTGPVTFAYLDRDDTVTQTMATFVSTTANCARCHAHKFDPISQEDYYALQANFAGIVKGDIPYDSDPNIAAERNRWLALRTAAEAKDPGVANDPANESLITAWLQRQGASPWRTASIVAAASSNGSTLTPRADHSVLASGPRPETDAYRVTIRVPTDLAGPITAVRLSVLADDSLPMHGPGRQDNGNLHLSEFRVGIQSGAEPPRDLAIRSAAADFNQTDWGIERSIDGNPATAWGIYPAVGRSHLAVFTLSEPVAVESDDRLIITLDQLHGQSHLIGAFQLAVTDSASPSLNPLPPDVEESLAVSPENRTPEQTLAIAAEALRQTASESLAALPPQAAVFAAGADIRLIGDELFGTPLKVAEPQVIHLLHRGDFDKPRHVVEPGALTALTHLPARFTLQNPKNESERRAALAEWIAHRDNLLTWRSIVNRVWQHHFGRGLCDTPSDFGRMGSTPTHPELLDWLAVWFRDEAGGSLKKLHRLILTSETYRQASLHRDDAAAIDGENRLLWRQNRSRLDADAVRDFTLAVSGRLELTMGGPAIKQLTTGAKIQLTPSVDYSTFDWSSLPARRRSIYRFVWRGIPDPMMDALDFPDLGMLTPVRGFSASALQALVLYNNRFVLYHADALAARVAAEAPTLNDRIHRAVQLAWQRNPTEAEAREFAAFAAEHGLPTLCRVLFNSNEFLFID
jgi:mono/diheme cytochrome c family protein